MFSFNLLYPWITLALVLVPLLWVQRWLHRHLFGVGYLISKEKQAATLFYYGLLLPGVILHELSHYLMAGIFNVRSVRFAVYPEVQEDGSLEMGFVQLEYVFNPVYAALIGIAPLLTGMLAVVLISNSALDLPGFFAQIGKGDIYEISAAIQKLVGRSDFVVWAYLLFGISNAMMPNREDRRGWWIVLIVVALFLGFMTLIGLGNIVASWLIGPIAQALSSLTAVFGTVLFVDAIAVVIVAGIEFALERVTGHKVEYQPNRSALAAGPARPSIKSVYELNLPLPPLPGKITAAPAPRLPAAMGNERPAISAGPARPALGSSSPPGPRPALGSGTPDIEKPAAASPGFKPPTPSFGSRPSGAPAKPDEPTPAKPAAPAASTPFGSKPATPAATPFGAKPGTSSPTPSGPPTPSKPATPAPASPFGRPPGTQAPAAQSSGISGSSGGTTGGTPFGAKPGTTSPAPSGPQTPGRPSTPAPSSPFGRPPGTQAPAAQSPGAPGTSGAPSTSGGTPNRPFGSPTPGGNPSKPANPISGPPALARPGGAPPGKPNFPAPANRPASPVPKPAFGASPRPTRPGSENDDYIDADVIEEEDDEPGFMRNAGGSSGSGANKPRSPFGSRLADNDKSDDADNDEPKYVGIDEA